MASFAYVLNCGNLPDMALSIYPAKILGQFKTQAMYSLKQLKTHTASINKLNHTSSYVLIFIVC